MSNRDTILTQWRDAASMLAVAKQTESDLRKQVIEAFSTEARPGHSGVENIDVGWNHTLRITHGLNYKLDNADNSAKVDKVLEKIQATTEGGSIIADRLVRWKPELSVTEYKLLSAANKALVDQILTITDATPTVVLVEPKGR